MASFIGILNDASMKQYEGICNQEALEILINQLKREREIKVEIDPLRTMMETEIDRLNETQARWRKK